LSAFQTYPRWAELAVKDVEYPSVDGDDPYLFLHDNFKVTTDLFPDEGIVFDAVDSQWEAFCRNTLDFHVPAECLALEDPPLTEQ
jgi:hypothetical protein